MLDYSEVKPHKFIVLDGVPYEVLGSHVFRKQQRKPVNVTKLKSLISGRVVENTFLVNETAEEAELDKEIEKRESFLSRAWHTVRGAYSAVLSHKKLLWPQTIDCPRKQNTLANMLDPRHPSHHTLNADTESRVWDCAVFTQIQIPIIFFFYQS